MEALQRYFADPEVQAALERDLAHLVGIPSSTGDPEGCRRAQEWLGARLEALGFTVRPDSGGTLRAARDGPPPRLLVLGHVDTVYPPAEPFRGLARMDEQGVRWLVGPGAADMKGGLVVLLGALAALQAVGAVSPALTVLVTRDEERGSPEGGAVVQAAAPEHDLALVLEPGFEVPGGTTLVVSRAGLLRLEVEVRGREAHAGNNRAEGLSAVAAAARLVEPLDALTDEQTGRLVTVCTFQGGKSINQVPGEARLGVDVRFFALEEGERLLREVERLVAERALVHPARGERTQAAVRVLGRKPPMVRLPGVEPYLRRLLQVGQRLGQPLLVGSRPGTSDGNFATAAGTPALDGLGAVGRDMHVSGREAVRADSLWERACLLAGALQAWAGKPPEAANKRC